MSAITIPPISARLKEASSWLINAGIDDTKHRLAAMTGTEDDMEVLRHAIAKEQSQPTPRSSRLKPMEAALRKFSEAARTALLSTKSTAKGPASTEVEIVTAAEVTQADLRASAERINNTIELIKGHQDAFEDATLEHRLCIGLEIAKAQQAFGMTVQEAGKLGGRPKEETLSTVDKVSQKPAVLTANPLGFSNWIKKETPDLPRPTAIRYAAGFRALGMAQEEATPAKIKAKLKDLIHHSDKASLPRPTLASLVKQAPKLPKPEKLTIIVPKSSKQLKLEDARETYHGWMETWDKALKSGHLENLDKKGLLQLQEFTATVRDRIKARLQ